MTLVRNLVVATVILGFFLSIFLLIDNGLKEEYSVIDDGTSSFTKYNNLSDDMSSESAKIAEGIKDLSAPASLLSIIDGLMTIATGFLQGIINILILPITFITYIVTDYGLPVEIIGAISVIISLIFGFIILSARLRNEV